MVFMQSASSAALLSSRQLEILGEVPCNTGARRGQQQIDELMICIFVSAMKRLYCDTQEQIYILDMDKEVENG